MIKLQYSRISVAALTAAFISQILERLNARIAPLAPLIRSLLNTALSVGLLSLFLFNGTVGFEVGINHDRGRRPAALRTDVLVFSGVGRPVLVGRYMPFVEVGQTLSLAALRTLLEVVTFVVRPRMRHAPVRIRSPGGRAFGRPSHSGLLLFAKFAVSQRFRASLDLCRRRILPPHVNEHL